MGERVERFEDLVAWQKARVLTARIYRVTSDGAFRRDFGLQGQMRRAAVSVMANIAEGFERMRAGEFHQFLSIAKGSCAELRAHLYIAYDAGYIAEPSFRELLDMAEEVARILGGLRATVAQRR